MKKRNHWLIVGIIIVSSMIIGSMYTEAQVTEEWQLQLEIQAWNSCCIYGTSVVFWEKDINLWVTEFTGDFLSYNGTTSRWCKDLVWTETWWAMTLWMSWDMENENGNKIPAGNVRVSFDPTTVIWWDCIPYNNSGTDIWLDTSVALVEKDGNIWTNYTKICELWTTNVRLKVVTEVWQAPGNYQGTIVITLPNFANSTCNSELIWTFYDAETDGLVYEGDQWSVWVTSGGWQFTYKPGEQITFKVGNVILGNPVIPEVDGSVFVTDLFGLWRTEITDVNVIKVGKLLQWLDVDDSPDNGITIEAATAWQITENENITTFDVDTKLTALSKTIRTSKEVVQHLESTAEMKLEENIDINYPWITKWWWTSPDQVISVMVSNSWNTFVWWYGVVWSYWSTTITNSWWYDIIVSKINWSGEYIWTKKWGWPGYDYLSSIVVDSLENLYVVWYYNSSNANFWSTSVLNSWSFDIFISKLDSSGNWLRTKKWGWAGSDSKVVITKDSIDNIYVAWWFQQTASFNDTVLVSNWWEDMFLSKLDSDWNILWIKKWWWSDSENINSIKLDSLNNIYVWWYFSSMVTLWSDTLINSWWAEFFVWKLDNNWNWIWAKKWGGVDHDYVKDITIDELWNIYVAWNFKGIVNFGSNQLITDWSADLFVRKLDNNWNSLWAVSWWWNDYDYANSIHADWEWNIYIWWSFRNNAVFWSNSLVSSWIDDALLWKISSWWNWLRTKSFGTASIDRIISIDCVSWKVYVGWDFSNTIKFASNTLTSSWWLDAFVRKIVDRDF